MEFSKYPSSKQEFENYLSERVDGILLQKILSDKNYSFKKNIQENVLEFYDWGFDNDDDKLKNYYTLDSLNYTKDGDLLLFSISFDRCSGLKRKEESKVKLFSNGILIERTINLGYSKIVEDFINKYVIKDYDKEDVYVPKDNIDFKRLSIIHYNLGMDKTWKSNLIKTEHQENFNQLIPMVTDFINNSEMLKQYKINEIILPISYYEADQLEKI